MMTNRESMQVDDGLDALDRALIVALQQDGRLTYAELGELVGLSSGGARLRVLRLQERGILQVVGVTDPLRLGYERMAMIGIEVDGDIRAVADQIGAIEGVIYLVLAAGTFDILVEVVAVDADALFELINERIRGVPGVAKAQTFSYYSIHTHRFTWGTR